MSPFNVNQVIVRAHERRRNGLAGLLPPVGGRSGHLERGDDFRDRVGGDTVLRDDLTLRGYRGISGGLPRIRMELISSKKSGNGDFPGRMICQSQTVGGKRKVGRGRQKVGSPERESR